MNLLSLIALLLQLAGPPAQPAIGTAADSLAAPGRAREQPPAAAAASYIIGPQDQLSIEVFGEDGMTSKYRVDETGSITFPLLGRIQASGASLGEFQERLRQRLADGYIRAPQVRVEIDEYRSQNVFVIGEVRSPGKITLTGGSMSVMEALSRAGSPTASASSELILVHPRKPGGAGSAVAPDDDLDADRTRINIKDLQIGKAGQDVVLQDGDSIFVPKAQSFYVVGQVKAPGAYVLDPGMTVLQAISLAGGLTDRGSDRGIRVERVVNGVRIVVDVKPTDPVQPNDTIQVRGRFF
jgi:polysaccharide export outer membrane protein